MDVVVDCMIVGLFACLSDLTAPAIQELTQSSIQAIISTLNSQVSIHEVEGCEGVEGGGLGAQAVVAKGDGLEAECEAAAQLVGTEVAFGSDEHEGVGAGGVELVEGSSVVAYAVADEFLRIEN